MNTRAAAERRRRLTGTAQTIAACVGSLVAGLVSQPAYAGQATTPERPVAITASNLGSTVGWVTNLVINDRGLVVGWGSGYAFALDARTGASETLPYYFEPQAINGRGQVVGIYDAPASAGGVQGSLWSERDGRRLLPDFLTLSINERGDLGGACIIGVDRVDSACVLLARRGTDTNVGTLYRIDVGPGAWGRVYDINDHGVAVGTIFYETGVSRAFVWSVRDGLRILDAPAQSTLAYAINNQGHIAGAIVGDDQVSHPATWVARSGALSAQLTTIAGWASDINARGIVLVRSYDPVSGSVSGKVWIPTRELVIDLRAPEPTALLLVHDINDRGEVVGAALQADGTSELLLWRLEPGGARP